MHLTIPTLPGHLRTWRLAGATLALALLMAGCGGGGGGDPSAAAPGAASAAGPSPAATALTLSSQADALLDLSATLAEPMPVLPPHYAGTAASDNSPAGTLATPAVAALGRVLFHDRQLSRNGAFSCASCHGPENGFGDAVRFSAGFDGGGVTSAHAMRLANLRFFRTGEMFWNRRTASLEAQSTLPIQHPIEMGFDAAHGGIDALLARLRGLDYYAPLFTAAFGDAAVAEPRLQQALALYLRSIVSTHSRWDTAFAQVFDATLPDKGVTKPLPGFTPEEDRGRHLFMAPRTAGGQACAACHQPPTFALGGSGSNGLDAGETVRFKSPSLKNVARSGAFMHDGRFASLEAVVEHYSSGVQDGPALDNRLKGTDGVALRPALPPEDKAALVSFLKTLSDPVLAADPRFASPFRADRAGGASAAAPSSL